MHADAAVGTSGGRRGDERRSPWGRARAGEDLAVPEGCAAVVKGPCHAVRRGRFLPQTRGCPDTRRGGNSAPDAALVPPLLRHPLHAAPDCAFVAYPRGGRGLPRGQPWPGLAGAAPPAPPAPAPDSESGCSALRVPRVPVMACRDHPASRSKWLHFPQIHRPGTRGVNSTIDALSSAGAPGSGQTGRRSARLCSCRGVLVVIRGRRWGLRLVSGASDPPTRPRAVPCAHHLRLP